LQRETEPEQRDGDVRELRRVQRHVEIRREHRDEQGCKASARKPLQRWDQGHHPQADLGVPARRDERGVGWQVVWHNRLVQLRLKAVIEAGQDEQGAQQAATALPPPAAS